MSKIEAEFTYQGAKGFIIKDNCLVSCEITPDVLVVPKGITKIGRGCFSGHDNLKKCIISSSVVEVEKFCFANCPNLEYIKCGDNLRKYESILKYGNEAKIIYVNSNSSSK